MSDLRSSGSLSREAAVKDIIPAVVQVGQRIVVVTLNAQQLASRSAGDLITAEIVAVHMVTEDDVISKVAVDGYEVQVETHVEGKAHG